MLDLTLIGRSSRYTYSNDSQLDFRLMPGAQDETMEEDEGLEGAEGDEEEAAGPSEKNALLDITVVPFEPLVGSASSEKLAKLKKAVQEKIQPPGNLTVLKEERYSRLVTLTVVFYIWKGSGKVNPRSAKELTSLLRPIFDVLETGEHGVGIIEKDSYICEVYATKELVESEKEEGYRIIMEEFENEEMLGVLNAVYGKST